MTSRFWFCCRRRALARPAVGRGRSAALQQQRWTSPGVRVRPSFLFSTHARSSSRAASSSSSSEEDPPRAARGGGGGGGSSGMPDTASAAAPYDNIPPVPRPGESVERKRARLAYQSRKRGILESDLLLSTFASRYLAGMSEQELADYDALLDQPDWDIYYWTTGKKVAPDSIRALSVFEPLRVHAMNEGREVRRMPDFATCQK